MEKIEEKSMLSSDISAHEINAIQAMLAEKDSKILSLENELNWFKEQ